MRSRRGSAPDTPCVHGHARKERWGEVGWGGPARGVKVPQEELAARRVGALRSTARLKAVDVHARRGAARVPAHFGAQTARKSATPRLCARCKRARQFEAGRLTA